jgi:D-alanyl-D-alanine carboxypeptidase (penicillin-binding protein 5/6)
MPLIALNATERRAPASTAKIVTALVVRQALDLDQVITVEEGDTVDPAVYSNMQLQVGDQLTVRDLLIGLLLPSGNDAALTLARVAGAELPGGDQDPVQAFIAAMNATAQSLGAGDSQFLHPAGEDVEGQYTTALDLTILAKALLNDDALATIVATPQWYITVTEPNARTYTVYNTNQLLGETGIIGVKTGSTEAAGACLVIAAAYTDTNRVVIVVLGSQLLYDESGVVSVDARFTDTLNVIRAINATYTWLTPADIANVPGLAQELAAWEVTLGDIGAIVVPSDAIGNITYRLQLGPSGEPGDEVGHVLFFIGEKQIAEFPVYQV